MQKLYRRGIIALLIFLFPMVAIADDITLAWDPNSEPDIAKYRIYQTRIPGTAASWTKVAEVDHPIVEVTLRGFAKDGKRFYWVATALDATGNESEHSNMVDHTFSLPPDTTPPAPPGGFLKKTVVVTGQLIINVYGDIQEHEGSDGSRWTPPWKRGG